MGKKILLISPVPSHPQNAGNRSRIYNLSLHLKKLGHEVHFLYITQEDGNLEAMRLFWEDKFHLFPYTSPPTRQKQRPKQLGEKISRKIKALLGKDPLFTYLIDDWYDENLNDFATKLQQKIHFDVVIVMYVFWSKILEYFDNNVLKIIDQNDKFANRYKLYQKNGHYPQWYSTTEREELKGLRRADAIISIQERDKEEFSRKLKDKIVITVGQIVWLHNAQEQPWRKYRKNLLFLASKNPINVKGINYFLESILPEIKKEIPDVKLLLVGNICDEIEDYEGCLKLGEVESIEEVYNNADIVINPMQFGTGLKIKSIEALGFSKPLVTTSEGAKGIEDGRDKSFLVADNPGKFAQYIIQLLSDDELYKKTSINAYNFAQQWNQENLRELVNLLNNKN